MKRPFLLLCAAAVAAFAADESYRKPPQEILDVLNAPQTPAVSVSPSGTAILFAQPIEYPPISEVGAPMLRLAGIRINPKTNGPHRALFNSALSLRRVNDGSETKIQLPPNARVMLPRWSPDGKRFAFTNTTDNAVELWIGDAANGRVHRLGGVRVNAVAQPSFRGAASAQVLQWMPDSRTLLVQTVPASRGVPPAEPAIPAGPHIQESLGHAGPVRTYEDMLESAHDEALFDYYATAQLAFVDAVTGASQPLGKPAIFTTVSPSPDGRDVLVARIHKPYSYLHPYMLFPKDVEVWTRAGSPIYKVASLPLEDRVPIEGVPTGPREYQWRPTAPATLVWVEALDGGDLKNKVPYRDRILMLKAPFTGEPAEIFKTGERFRGIAFGEKGDWAIVQDYERKRRWERAMLIHPDQPATPSKLLWELNAQDRYKNPGTPVRRMLANGHYAILQDGDSIYLEGPGASPQGDRPFVDRKNLETGAAERLFHSGSDCYETFVAMVDPAAGKILTSRETPSAPPNFYVRLLNAAEAKALTDFTDPTPQIRGITKQLVTYKRQDGVPLSFTLYLPAGYKEGTRLPTVVWAYPLEYNDAATAGQISGSTQRFTRFTGPTHLFFLMRGYAILDNAAMPVIGDPDTVNNTYLDQIVADARAAIDKAVDMGVTDRNRVGVGGHSYGAFMTANLLAHSTLFRAGIARSGAYNRTLTPFGFQTERRTLWEAPEIYLRMSPFLSAGKIKAPILLIHGEADDNQGTFPVQSERMYAAIRGNGGTVRLVFLPAEAHGYQARESIEHTLYEMITWFDRYVKNPEDQKAQAE